MRETEEQPGEEGTNIRPERNAFPRRATSRLGSRTLPLGGQAEEGGEGIWHPEQGDGRPGSRWGTGIPCQPLGFREPIMCPLCSREDRRRRVWVRRQGLLKRHVRPLATQQLHAGAPMRSTTPILPEQRCRVHRERMQQQTDPTRLCRLSSVPLTLFAQRAEPTVSNPGGVE